MGSPRGDRALDRKLRMHETKKEWTRTFDTVGGAQRITYVHKDGTRKTVWAESTIRDMIQRHLESGTADTFWAKLATWLGEQQGEMIIEWANDCFLAVEKYWEQHYAPSPPAPPDLFAEVDTMPDLFG